MQIGEVEKARDRMLEARKVFDEVGVDADN